jgi:thiol-disulfide isomerase/thioredoxin
MPRAAALTLGVALGTGWAGAEPLETRFNDAALDWYPLDVGLAKAAAEGKLVLALVKTDWCPHCRAHQAAFTDERVVAHAGDFVFVLLDRDHEAELTAQVAPDGDYVPRTMILTDDRKVIERLAPFGSGPARFSIPPPYADELAGYLGWVLRQPEFPR